MLSTVKTPNKEYFLETNLIEKNLKIIHLKNKVYHKTVLIIHASKTGVSKLNRTSGEEISPIWVDRGGGRGLQRLVGDRRRKHVIQSQQRQLRHHHYSSPRPQFHTAIVWFVFQKAHQFYKKKNFLSVCKTAQLFWIIPINFDWNDSRTEVDSPFARCSPKKTGATVADMIDQREFNQTIS